MENKEEFKRFCNILHVCANYVQSCPGDILIDLPHMWEQYLEDDENWPVLTVRKSGADSIKRFEDILIDRGKAHGFEDCIGYAKRSLGVDFCIEITPYLVIVTNINTEGRRFREIISRLKPYTEVVIAE